MTVAKLTWRLPPGTVFLFALPMLFPGHLPMAPGKFFGPTPSFRAWR